MEALTFHGKQKILVERVEDPAPETEPEEGK
mgnify:CR=1 FL=1